MMLDNKKFIEASFNVDYVGQEEEQKYQILDIENNM